MEAIDFFQLTVSETEANLGIIFQGDHLRLHAVVAYARVAADGVVQGVNGVARATLPWNFRSQEDVKRPTHCRRMR